MRDLNFRRRHLLATGAALLAAPLRSALAAGDVASGRPITLVGGDDRAWTNRATVLALMAKAATPGAEMTLTLNDARTYTVMFRHGDGKPVDARPVVAFNTLADDDYYTLTLRLMEI